VVESRTSQPDLPLAPDAQPADAAAALAPPPDPALDALERALALQQEGEHAHVIEAAVPHLEPGGPAEGAESSFVRAALWTLVGVARHALGDIEGAQGALDAAVRVAPDGVSEDCPQRIAVAAAPSARQLLAAADAMSATSGERVAVLRMAVLWLEWRIVAAPPTEEVSVLLDRAREALWDGYALAGRGLMRRRQFAQTRELVRQALDLEDLPAARRAPLAELAARCIVRQIGRLVATARGTETTDAAALDSLERAREILAASSVDAVTPGRWHSANRRIWNGYMRRGRRDIVAFDLEAALRPLFRALHLKDLDLGLERKTRELLARTIERISDGAGERIERLLEAGDRDAAMQRWQDVRGIIQKARDQGLSHEELAHAFGRARQMLEQIEAKKG
jgi:tetratricopeptide (TPR) repeat protein